MADRGRPSGTKKQGAPQKIINLLDQVLRYNNELSLLDNIQNWVAQTCNINITLLSNKNQEFESLKIIELDDDNILRLDNQSIYSFPFVHDQYHLLHLTHLKILDEIISKKISPQILNRTIADAISTITQSNISFNVVAVNPPPARVQYTVKVNLSKELRNKLRAEEFQTKMKAPYLEFWQELEKIVICLCKYEEKLMQEPKLKQEPKMVYKFIGDEKKSKEKLIEVLCNLEQPTPDKNVEHSSILEVLPPKDKNREYVSKFFGLKKSALKNGLSKRGG
jgi:hypothetical protein